MENLAERLFVDLKNSGIKIEAPEYMIDGAKIGMFPNLHQYVIFCKNDKYTFGEGLTWQDTEEFQKSFTEAYNEFLNFIKKLGHRIKFYGLVIPRRGVIDVKLLEFETVTARYIKDYLHISDDVVERWDVLVQEVNPNA